MKKFYVLLIVFALITCLTACTSANTPSSQPTQSEEATETSVDFEALSLVDAYCNNTWDGSFISNDEHCASVIDGQLWLDCKPSEQIPDLGPHENCFWATVVSSNDTGTWIHDRQIGTFELWNKGTRYNKIVLQGSLKGYNTSVCVLSDCIVARNDTDLDVYNLKGGIIRSVRDVIDFYSTSENELLYSNFEHRNFKFTGEGEILELDSNYVRFPRENVQLEEDQKASTAYFNLFWGTTWDGTFKMIDDDRFAYVDYSGDIYVNNELMGNVNLPIDQKIHSLGSNLMTGIDETLYLNGKELIIYQKAAENVVDIPDGSATFLWNSNSGTVILVYGLNSDDNKLVIVKDEEVSVIEKVSDANVAYDTLYYMEGDTVYRMSWEEVNAEPELFIQGAYAVSTHTDEGEGAIVPNELNNMESYGEYNLYSPFGS